MAGGIHIRESRQADLSELETLYPNAFPEEDLLPLVRALLGDAAVFSLVAVAEGAVTGHVIFTDCSDSRALLGPLAVAADRQGKGIGSALVREGLKLMERSGAGLICVLGDPNYYGRFGFEPEELVLPPYPLPEEWLGAWQSLRLGGFKASAGQLAVPEPWRNPALWSP